MMALGIPGSATTAVMMAGLMIWGLQPGPMLFIEQSDFVWGLIASMYVANLVAMVLILTTMPFFASILKAPFSIVGPIIIVVCLIGVYTIENRMFNVYLALIFGVVGYLFKKLDYPIAPLILAMVLGEKTENAFRQSLLMSQGSFSIFVDNLLAITLVILSLLLVCWGFFPKINLTRAKV